MQKVLTIVTQGPSLRDEAEGWTMEDADCFGAALEEYAGKYNQYTIPVGLVRSGLTSCSYYTYPTVLHALGDGWKLLTPPTQFDAYAGYLEEYKKENSIPDKLIQWEWWLVKD